MVLFKGENGTDTDGGLGGLMSKCAGSLSSSFISSELDRLWVSAPYVSWWVKSDPRKAGGIRMVDSNETGSGTLAASFSMRLADPRREVNIDGTTLRYRATPGVLPTDVLGVGIGCEGREVFSLRHVSGSFRKALQAREETVCSKSCLVSCFRGIWLRLVAS